MLIFVGVILSLCGLVTSAGVLPASVPPATIMFGLAALAVLGGARDLTHRHRQEKELQRSLTSSKEVLEEVLLLREERDHLTTIVREGRDKEDGLNRALREAQGKIRELEERVSKRSQGDASALVLLALLQERGKFLDFAGSDLSQYQDDKVGKVARFVHQGCQSVLTEFCELLPVASEPEGTTITLQSGFDANSYRVLGALPPRPPYSGKMIHRGWRVAQIRLPQRTSHSDDESMVVFPAEVEIAV